MIKKSIKSFNFVIKETPSILDGLVGHYIPNIDNLILGNTLNMVPNQYVVRLDIENNPNPQFVLQADGDAIFTGRVHSLGSVLWNQVLNRLEFWNGEIWVPINT